ncbi:MAG: hypothetical protein E7497_00085 [Ruminococcus sp.]|nr:hypothetical protein [Ruminococcus sp.]
MLSEYDTNFSYEDMENLSLSSIIDSVLASVTARLKAPFRLLGTILITIVFASLMHTAGDTTFPKSPSANLYNMVCVISAAAVICPPLLEAYENSSVALEKGSGFMLAFVPVYVAISVASGNIVSAGVYNTITLAAAEIIVQLSSCIVMPLVAMTAALSITGSVFPETSAEGIVRLIKKLITWGLTVSMTLFSGFVSLKSTLGNTVDGFASKSVKFVVSGLVPVVGSAVTDAYSTVKGSFEVMKCTTGTAGTIAVIILMLPPILEIFAFRAALWAGTAAAEMFSVAPLEKLFKGLDSGLAIALSVLICFSVLFIISTAILMKTV